MIYLFYVYLKIKIQNLVNKCLTIGCTIRKRTQTFTKIFSFHLFLQNILLYYCVFSLHIIFNYCNCCNLMLKNYFYVISLQLGKKLKHLADAINLSQKKCIFNFLNNKEVMSLCVSVLIYVCSLPPKPMLLRDYFVFPINFVYLVFNILNF